LKEELNGKVNLERKRLLMLNDFMSSLSCVPGSENGSRKSWTMV